MKKILFLFLFLVTTLLFAQEIEIISPYHIKTVTFVQANQNVFPMIQLGDSFQLQFDDLHGTEDNYYYRLTHCDYNWKQSQLSINEYITGFNDQRIINYTNSVNTLQVYSHYILSFPNQFTSIKVSGNYVLSILNEDREVVFSRKFIVYENLVSVPIQVKRAREVKYVEQKHNLDFAIKSATITFQRPLEQVKVLLMQNAKFSDAIYNVKPQYTIGNDLIYKYDKETQFWAGNEYLYFENKIIRAANNTISRVDTNTGLYNCLLYTNQARANQLYTYFPDINGNFLVNNIGVENNAIESDYAWIYFSLSAPSYFSKNPLYITGMFNNNTFTDENKLDYNAEKGLFEKAIMIKQGFTNYGYTILKPNSTLEEENAIDGNFYQTENQYDALIYYRENNQRYDRIIGRGTANSIDIIN
ncbi:MAG: hypothetical protein ACI9XR_001648 [Flavobacterium sp.]